MRTWLSGYQQRETWLCGKIYSIHIHLSSTGKLLPKKKNRNLMTFIQSCDLPIPSYWSYRKKYLLLGSSSGSQSRESKYTGSLACFFFFTFLFYRYIYFLYYYITTLLHYNVATLLRCYITILLPYYNIALLHYYITTLLLHYYITTLLTFFYSQ